jgi:hypothetical protein
MPHECFADEIAIDFPSVVRVVDRMRDAFLGERPDADLVSADVHLTVPEARRGRTVSLEVPIRDLCSACGGRGETWTERCDRCGGTGESLVCYPVRVAVPARVSDGARFRFRVSSPDAAPVRVEVRVSVGPLV